MASHPAKSLIVLCFGVLVSLCQTLHASKALQKLESCTLIETPWADGDSFRIRTAKGSEHTIRLYGADCLEATVTDESDARRLRAQRRYFGISQVKPKPAESIEVAKGFGKKATEETVKFLQKPFTVFTAFSDARGDQRYQRVYGFVVDQNGRDLAAHLVSQGLARAFGVYRANHQSLSRDDYRDHLKDLELLAAKRGKGIWAHTNWDTLLEARNKQRKEEAEIRMTIDHAKLPDGARINPNTAALDQLMRVPGIGETMANRIIEGRPYEKAEGLLKVSGIGRTTLAKIKPYLAFE